MEEEFFSVRFTKNISPAASKTERFPWLWRK